MAQTPPTQRLATGLGRFRTCAHTPISNPAIGMPGDEVPAPSLLGPPNTSAAEITALTRTGAERSKRNQIWRKGPGDFERITPTKGKTERLNAGEPVGAKLTFRGCGHDLYDGSFAIRRR